MRAPEDPGAELAWSPMNAPPSSAGVSPPLTCVVSELQDPLETRRSKILPALTCLWFAFWTLGQGLVDGLAPRPIPRLRGREATQLRELWQHFELADGSLMKLIDMRLRLRSNLRESLLPWYAGALLAYADEGGPEVLVGREEWLYLRDRLYPTDGLYQPRAGRSAGLLLASLDRQLAALGMDWLLLPIPRKGVATAKMLPAGVDPVRAFDEQILADLAHREIPHVNLLAEIQAEPAERTWFRRDSHWSFWTQALAAERCAEALAGKLRLSERTAKARFGTRSPTPQGTLIFAGIPNRHPASRYWFRRPKTRSLHLSDWQTGKSFEASAPGKNPSLVLAGTSFSAGGMFIPLLRNALERDLEDATGPGLHALDALATVLTERSGHLPDKVLLELPIYQLFPEQAAPHAPLVLSEEVGRAFLKLPTPRLWPIPLAPASRQPNGDLKLHLQPGSLITTGAGEILLRLESPGPSSARLELQHADLMWRIEQPASAGCLPLLGLGQANLSMHAGLQRAGTDTRLSLMTAYDLDQGPIAKAASAPRIDPAGWTWQFTFDTPAQAQPHAAIWLQLPAGNYAYGALELALSPSDPDRAPLTFPAFQPQPGAAILLSLGRDRGPWSHITLQGLGLAPTHMPSPRLVSIPSRKAR